MPSKAPKPTPGRTDWAALRAMPDETIERIAAEDEDNPATDDGHWEGATAALPPCKVSVHASFDRDVIDFFKRGGRDYQTRMNAVLRGFMDAQKDKEADR